MPKAGARRLVPSRRGGLKKISARPEKACFLRLNLYSVVSRPAVLRRAPFKPGGIWGFKVEFDRDIEPRQDPEEREALKKRRYPRFRAVLPCEVEGLDCEIQEVSVHGFRLSSKRPLLPGETRETIIRLIREDGREQVLQFQAAIRWCEQTPSGEYWMGAEVEPSGM